MSEGKRIIACYRSAMIGIDSITITGPRAQNLVAITAVFRLLVTAFVTDCNAFDANTCRVNLQSEACCAA
jgi:hypothetical protein